jgi:hypothetical protein
VIAQEPVPIVPPLVVTNRLLFTPVDPSNWIYRTFDGALMVAAIPSVTLAPDPTAISPFADQEILVFIAMFELTVKLDAPAVLTTRLLNVVDDVPPRVWLVPLKVIVPPPGVNVPLLVQLPPTVRMNAPEVRVAPVAIVILLHTAVLIFTFG